MLVNNVRGNLYVTWSDTTTTYLNLEQSSNFSSDSLVVSDCAKEIPFFGEFLAPTAVTEAHHNNRFGDTGAASLARTFMSPASKPISIAQSPTLTLTFSPNELTQLKAFAALHGESVEAFVQRAALEAAQITSDERSAPQSARSADALWLTESFADIPEPEKTLDLFAPVADQPEPQAAEAVSSETALPAKRGVVGEQSKLAKGKGLVWEIRRALGQERLHGLGWTREHLAFVLKLSVVGVRKMEHEGTTPMKSLHARQTLLDLAKALDKPTPEILDYIEREEWALKS
jgi:hypothetical protein